MGNRCNGQVGHSCIDLHNNTSDRVPSFVDHKFIFEESKNWILDINVYLEYASRSFLKECML